MQASVYGKRGILPALSRALHLESGILGKFGLSFGDDSAAVFDDFLLAVFVSRIFYQINSTVRKRNFYPTTYNFSHFCLNLFYLSFLHSAI